MIKRYRHAILLVLICIVGLYTVFTDGGMHVRDLRYDEAYTVFIIKKSRSELWWHIYNDVHQPIYYRIVKLRGYIRGYSDVAIRSFSVLPYIVTVLFGYKISYSLTKNKVLSVISAAAIAASPFLREYAQEARMYELLAALWMIVFYYSLRIIETGGSSRDKWITGLSWLFAFFIHYFSLFYGVGYIVLLLVILTLQEYKKCGKNILATTLKVLLAQRKIYLPIVVGVLICLPLMLHQYGIGYVGSVLQPMNFNFVVRSIGVFFLGHEQGALGIQPVNKIFSADRSYITGIKFLCIGVLVCIAACIRIRRRKNIFVVGVGRGALFAIIILSIIKGNNMYVERYLIFITPMLIIGSVITIFSMQKIIGYIFGVGMIVYPVFIVQPTFVRNGLRDYAKVVVEKNIPAVAIKSDLDYLVVRNYLEEYHYQGIIYLWTNDPRTPQRSIYRNTPNRVLNREQLSGTTALITYDEQTGAERLPYKFGFANIYLYTPTK